MHLPSVIPANDTRESVFGHRKFPHHKQGLNLGPLEPEAIAQLLSYLIFLLLRSSKNVLEFISIQVSEYLKIGTCPASQNLLAYMGKI